MNTILSFPVISLFSIFSGQVSKWFCLSAHQIVYLYSIVSGSSNPLEFWIESNGVDIRSGVEFSGMSW